MVLKAIAFPEGFGFPVFTNENLLLATQSLNHNIKGDPFDIKHEVTYWFQTTSQTDETVNE